MQNYTSQQTKKHHGEQGCELAPNYSQKKYLLL